MPKKRKRKNRPIPRVIEIHDELHALALFRVVEINGEKILKPIADDEEVHLKHDPNLNVFVTGYIPVASLKNIDIKLSPSP